MRDEVLVRVRVAATERAYDFLVPLDLCVADATYLVSQILRAREPLLFEPTGAEELMVLLGPHAGELLDGGARIRALVAHDVLVDGTPLALV